MKLVCDLKTAIIASPAPQGAGGLKLLCIAEKGVVLGPAPQGAGGLKCTSMQHYHTESESRPARGGWIEMGFRMQTS